MQYLIFDKKESYQKHQCVCFDIVLFPGLFVFICFVILFCFVCQCCFLLVDIRCFSQFPRKKVGEKGAIKIQSYTVVSWSFRVNEVLYETPPSHLVRFCFIFTSFVPYKISHTSVSLFQEQIQAELREELGSLLNSMSHYDSLVDQYKKKVHRKLDYMNRLDHCATSCTAFLAFFKLY